MSTYYEALNLFGFDCETFLEFVPETTSTKR